MIILMTQLFTLENSTHRVFGQLTCVRTYPRRQFRCIPNEGDIKYRSAGKRTPDGFSSALRGFFCA